MSNHAHLLVMEKDEPLAAAIKRISGSYVYWYNKKYGRCGHLFQERYKSETVEDDGYLLTVLRYIHQNPVKAGISQKIDQYPWSGYREYIGKSEMIDKDFILGRFTSDRKNAVEQFERYMNEPNEDKCLEDEEKILLTDNEVRGYLKGLGFENISDLQQMEKNKRDEIIRTVKSMEGISIRQLSRITGISKSVIERV